MPVELKALKVKTEKHFSHASQQKIQIDLKYKKSKKEVSRR